MKFKIMKGWHFSRPRKPRRVRNELKFECVLHTPYDLGDVDQKDWNKVTGITASWWRPSRNAFMLGFRWNVTKKVWEVAPYININNSIKFPPNEDIVEVKTGEKFTCRMYYSKGVWYMTINGKKIKTAISHMDRGRHWRIQPYFGGNRKAPNTMIVEINYK